MTGDNTFRLTFSHSAEEDIRLIVEDLVKNKPLKAGHFSDDLRRVRAYLIDNPFMYQDYYLFLKRAPLRRSGYNLFYAVDTINWEIEIMAVIHQKASLDLLRQRLNL